MKAKRFADLASSMCNSAEGWAGSLDPEERDGYRRQCKEIKRALRIICMDATAKTLARAERVLETIR